MVIHSQILKVLVLGNSSVGKTSLMDKYVKNLFSFSTKQTIGVDFALTEIVIDNTLVKLQIWDTSGQERFNSLCPSYYRGADGCMLVYDVTDPDSFENLDYWRNQLLTHAISEDRENFPFVLVGNKVDLPFRQISSRKAEEQCESSYMCPYFETSAKNGLNVDHAFKKITEMALARVNETKIHTLSYCAFPEKKKSCFNFRMC